MEQYETIGKEKEKTAVEHKFKELTQACKNCSKKDVELLQKAFDFAKNAYGSNKNASGELQLLHSLSVALIVAFEIGLSASSVIAALLHDTIETEDLVDIGADTPDVLAFNPSETENPIRLPDMTRGNVKFKPVGPEFGPSASDSLFTGPEALRLSRMEGFGESRGSGDILGGAGGIGSPGSSLGAKLEKDFKNKDILLVWLVDSSPSLFDQVDMLKGQIKPLFDRLNKYSPGRLSMTVISYGERAEPALEKPTRDPAAVMAALAAIKKKSYQRVKQKALARYRNPRAKVAPSVENTMHALCQAATLRAGDGRQIVIALLTDERGDDAAGWQYALKALRAKGIPLFVFGPTTRIFSERRPELLVLQDDAFISDKPRNPHGAGGIWAARSPGANPAAATGARRCLMRAWNSLRWRVRLNCPHWSS